MDYRINKGAGRPIEFKGLKSQYLFFFAGGLVSVFLAVVVLYMAGVSQLVCLSFGSQNIQSINQKEEKEMRSVLKACDLEDRFPILAVENNCIVSKDADITVAFEVELPELYTVTATEYEAIHGTWVKAMKVLPNYSVVYKQDWFVKENYRSEGDGTESFLSRSYERHFNERPYLRHRCFLYLTKTTRERARRRSDFSTLCRGYILPKEITDWDSVVKFLEAVEQFERIMNDSGHVRMKRLRTEEVVGTEECPGLIERYLTLGMEDTHPVLQDICLDPERMRIGDKRLCLHVLSDTEDLPGSVGTDMRYERLSTDRSDCRLSFAAPVGLLLSCNHVYSQYVFIDDAQEILQRMEKTSRNMLSLSKYSRSNAVNYEWAEMYLDEAHTKGLVPVRCHCNVLAWAEDEEELRRIKNDTGSQLALMGCVPIPFWNRLSACLLRKRITAVRPARSVSV